YWDALAALLHGPLETFRRETRVRSVLFVDGSGRVLARSGLPLGADLAGFATLAAGIHAAAREMTRLMNQPDFSQLYQGRGENQIFMGVVPAPHGELLGIAIFDDETNVGLVRT